MKCPSCGIESPVGEGSCRSCGRDLLRSASLSDLLTADGFVGRQQELNQLTGVLQDALRGQVRLVMLAGEPGIGKTRMAQELSAYAETRGAQVLWGRCYEGEGAPPYWPWIQALRSYLDRVGPAQLRAEMGPGASVIAEMIPELLERLPALETPSSLEPQQARFRLFDSVATFLRNAAKKTPLVLVLDDLHWADRSSLLLLEFLAQELQTFPLLLVGTYRDVEVSRQHPLSQTLGSLVRNAGFTRLQLGCLSQSEVAQLLEVTPGWESIPQTIAAVHQRTEGNPLFLNELLRGTSPQMLASESGDLSGVPEGVKDAIGKRLNRLSERCNEVLTTASIIGREFGFGLLGHLISGVSEEELLASMEEALSVHLIDELPGSPTGYQFSHALIQDVLAGELSAARRVRLHARIGEALEELYRADAESHASGLAYHFGQAEPLLGPQKLVEYSLIAGEQALATYAWEDALVLFERGLAAKEGRRMDAQTAALLFGLGRAQATTLPRERMNQTVASMNRSLDYYLQTGDVPGAIKVAEYTLPLALGCLSGVADRIARALELIPPDSLQAGRLLSNHGRVLGTEESDYTGARESLDHALAIARSEGDATLEMRVLADSARVNFYHCHYHESVEQSLRALELAQQSEDSSVEEDAHSIAAFAQCAQGNLEEARRHGSAALSIAERQRDRYWLANVIWRNQNIAGLGGEWHLACSLGERAQEVAPKHPGIFACRLIADYQLGNIVSDEPRMGDFLKLIHSTVPGPTLEYASLAMVTAEVTRITGESPHIEDAKAAAKTVVSSPHPLPFFVVVARAGAALLAVMLSDVAAATSEYAALEPLKGTLVPMYFIAVDHLLGLLSHTIGKEERAMAHFEDALAFCRKAGYQPDLAWTCYDYAHCLHQRDNTGDSGKAKSLLDEALAISTELGMLPLNERVVALQQQLQAQLEPVPAYPDGLTQREVEVIRLVALGKTDRDIALELVIAESTVRRHVSNIYVKIAASNRAEATRYALRANLVSIDDAYSSL